MNRGVNRFGTPRRGVGSAFLVLAAVVLVGAAPAGWSERTVTGLGLRLVRIHPGTFVMGSPPTEPGRHEDEGPQTRVALTRGFWLGKFEVTRGQWRRVMGTDLLDQAKLGLEDDNLYLLGGRERTIRDRIGLRRGADPQAAIGNVADDLPIYWVNWFEAVEFCRRLTLREAAAGRLPRGYVYRLPTEAEWEYAARAGSAEATYAGPIQILGERNAPVLDGIAWYAGNSSHGYRGKGWSTADWAEKQYPGGDAGPRAVGLKAPNAWGLYDMLGNVNEWTADWLEPHLPGGVAIDPEGPPSGQMRVIKGGSWFNAARGARSADRDKSKPGRRFFGLGFRIALAPGLRHPSD